MEYIVISGDQLIFDIPTTMSSMLPNIGLISGTSTVKTDPAGIPFCLESDAYSVNIPGVVYATAATPIPGVGTITITKLASNQIAKTRADNQPLILATGKFEALFTVNVPSSNPTGAMDISPMYKLTGEFLTANADLKAE